MAVATTLESLAHHLLSCAATRALEEPSAFEAALVTNPESLAFLVYVAARHETVGELLTALARPGLALIVEGQRACLRCDARGGEAEFHLVFLARTLADLTAGRFAVEQTLFSHDRVVPAALPVALGRVSFGQPRNELVFARSSLELSIDLAAALHRVAGLRLLPSPALDDRLRRTLEGILVAGERPTLERVASLMALSPRALQRALQQGPSFQDLVSEVSSEQALALLRNRPDLSIKEIAVRLGFSGTRAFSRAFRRWFGRNPSEVRHVGSSSSVPPPRSTMRPRA